MLKPEGALVLLLRRSRTENGFACALSEHGSEVDQDLSEVCPKYKLVLDLLYKLLLDLLLTREGFELCQRQFE